MSIFTPDTIREVRVSQTNWLNLLPDIKGIDVLKVGVKQTDSIVSISYSNPKALCCIGAVDDELNDIVDMFYDSVDAVTVREFDLIIFDEPECFTELQSFKKIKKMLLKASELLSEKGILMLCCPDGVLNIKYRYYINKTLSSTRFSSKSYYLCEPSAEEPMSIVPYSADSAWLIGGFPNFNEKPFLLKAVAKRYIKEIIFNLMRIYYPFRGLLLVASQPVNTDNYLFSSFKRLKKVIVNKDVTVEYEGNTLRYVCYTGRYLKKHYLFFYNYDDDDIVLIAKIGYSSNLPIDDIEREYKNLILMAGCQDEFIERKIKIATLVHYDYSPVKSVLIQSAVSGKSLRYILCKYKYQNSKNEILSMLDQITDAQLYIQDTFSRKLNNSVARINKDYFVNYTDMVLDCELLEQSRLYSFIQHGDFTANNIFYDEKLEQWGIIDWEWLSMGFPPMFDIFSLYASVRYTNTDINKYNEFDGYYISLVDTFFDKNWFSEYLVKLLVRYCEHYHLEVEDSYNYFIAFILFHCNKFRKNALPEYQHLYEKILIFAEENKHKYLLNQMLEEV